MRIKKDLSSKRKTTVTEKCFPGDSNGKESACNAGDLGLIPGLGRSSGEGSATHSSVLAWEIPWTEEPGGLQSTCHKESVTTEQLILSQRK